MQDVYYAGSYVRISKEDGDSNEKSLSIQNQLILIQNYVKNQSNMVIVKEYSDDGYSGKNFQRPSFQTMLMDIEEGIINTVIVKDLSRLGRDYIETGRYIEEIFPMKNIRFISINENIDSLSAKSNEDIIIPFLNLINESYLRDISMKIRSSLTSKKQNGDFVAAFPPYGYQKKDKYQLAVDEEAAMNVKRIFSMYLEGYSQGKIAESFNNEGIYSPAEYKRINTETYQCGGKKGMSSRWSAETINRILKNKVYIGTLQQGKTRVLSHKSKIRKVTLEKDLIQHEKNHEPIIDEEFFRLVQLTLKNDNRRSPGENKLYLFSGVLRCGNCGVVLTRRTKTIKQTTYSYYGCYDAKTKKLIHRCNIREDALLQTVQCSIKKHIQTVVELSGLYHDLEDFPVNDYIELHERKITECNKKIEEYTNIKVKAYQDMCDGILTINDYKNFIAIFDKDIVKLQEVAEYNENKKSTFTGSQYNKWVDKLKELSDVERIDRILLLYLIKEIIINENGNVEIVFHYYDEFQQIKAIVT